MSADALPAHAAATIADGIHGIVAGTIADQTAMDAGLVVDPGPGTRALDANDVASGKVFQRLDTGQLFRPTSSSPVAWAPLGGAYSRTASAWIAANTVLPLGSLGHESDTGRVKIGDGSTAWNSLYYFGAAPRVQAAGPVGSTFVVDMRDHSAGAKVATCTLTSATACAISAINVPSGVEVTINLYIRNPLTGTVPAVTLFAGATLVPSVIPPLSTTLDKITVYRCVTNDGGATWWIFLVAAEA